MLNAHQVSMSSSLVTGESVKLTIDPSPVTNYDSAYLSPDAFGSLVIPDIITTPTLGS
jgi:hypothetical protein